MKIKDIVNEVLPSYDSVPRFYKRLGQTSQLIRPTIYKQAGDIGDYYVHARPGFVDKVDKTSDKEVTTAAPVTSTEPGTETPTAAKEKTSTKDKTPTPSNKPVLYSVITKSGMKISKHNDGTWRTPEGQVLDDPDLLAKLEQLSTAQRQTQQMAPGYQPMPAPKKIQGLRRRAK